MTTDQQVLDNAKEISYMKGKVEGIDKKVDDVDKKVDDMDKRISSRQDGMDKKLDTLLDQMSMTRTVLFAGKAFLAGCLALLGANLDGIIVGIKHLATFLK